MAQTYTRQSSMSDGDTITAALFNNEYNQLLNAFAYSSSSATDTGHRHDGTAAQGGNIHTIGDLDFLNKIVVDSTNNRWGVFVEVSSAAVEQIRISDGLISPVTDNDIDLGTSSLEFKDAYFDGTVTTDGLTVSGTTNLDGAIQVDNTITVGVDDTGYDVKFFGDTASAYMLWDTSTDDLVLAGAAGIDLAGDLDVDGTTNLDVVDIDGAVDMASTLGVTGVLTANAGVVVDNITIDGTEIDLSSGDLTIDVAGDLFLDAGGGTIRFKDGGTTIADISNNSSDLQIEAKVQDKDIKFLGDDGGSGITALTLDMSEAGAATFNNKVVATELDISGNADIDGTTNLDAVDIDGAVQIDNTVTVGVDDTGYDVKFFGATSGSYMLWDESHNDLKLFGGSSLFVAGSVDFDGALDVDGTTNLDAVDIDGAVQIDNTVTVGVDDTGYDVKFFGDTASAYMLWDTSADDLVLAGAAGIDLAGDIDVDGTANLDNTDIDGTLAVDGATISLDATTSLNIDNSNTSNGITIGTATSGVPISIGHSTSEVTVNDNLTVTGTLTLGSGAELAEAELEMLDGITAGTVAASKAVVVDSNKDAASFRNITLTGELDAATLDISGNADIDGTTNLDAVDIDGATQIDATVTVGVNDTGYDVKFFGATSGAYMLWDESADDLKLVGAAGFTVAGDIDIDGTSNLDVVDIDGAVDMATTLAVAGNVDFNGDLDVDGTSNLDAVDVDGAVNFAADVTYADGADIITASAGTSNFRAGVNAGNSIQSGGNYNVCVGDEAGTALTTGDSNTAAGYQALKACTTTGDNVAIGKDALLVCETGAYNTAVGTLSLDAVVDTNANVAIGAYTLGACTGGGNTAIGYAALTANTSAANNVAVGVSALAANTTGTNNVAVGANALDANVESHNNTAIGDNALGKNSSGASNTAVGANCLVEMVDANYCTAIGADALQNATGGANTAVGQGALNGVEGGIYNTGLGYSAGNVISSGDNNLCLGRDAGIANSPGGAVTTGDNQICLGDENIANAHIQVDWTVASDERDKTDFTDLNLGLDFVKALEPVTYKWDKRSKYAEKGDDLDTITHDGTHKEDWLDVGFKAQAVEALEKEAGYVISDKTNLTTHLTEDGKQYGLQYSKFVPILVKAIQELSEKVKELESKSHNKCEWDE